MKNEWLDNANTLKDSIQLKTSSGHTLDMTDKPEEKKKGTVNTGIDPNLVQKATEMLKKGGAFIYANSIKDSAKERTPEEKLETEKLKDAIKSAGGLEGTVSMGFTGHPFATPTAVIPRTFRFLLQPKSHPELSYMVKKVGINYYEQTIEVEMYEHPDFKTHDYLLYLSDVQNKDHELTLTALDGCGRKLYLLHFKGVEPDDHYVEYNYEKSDVLTHKLTLSYEEMKRTDNKH